MQTLRRVLIALVMVCVAIFFTGCGTSVDDRDVAYRNAAWTMEQVQRAGSGGEGSLALIDVRSPADFARERIPGSANFSLADFASTTSTQGASPGEAFARARSPRVIYAADPASAVPRALAKRLMRLGLDDVYVLQGGLLAWKRAGGAVEGEKSGEPTTP